MFGKKKKLQREEFKDRRVELSKKQTKAIECVEIELPHIDRMQAINKLSSAIEKLAIALTVTTSITIKDNYFLCTDHPGVEMDYERDTTKVIITGEKASEKNGKFSSTS